MDFLEDASPAVTPNSVVLGGGECGSVGLGVSVGLALAWEDRLERFFPEEAGIGHADDLIPGILVPLEGARRNMDVASAVGVGPDLKLLGHGPENEMDLLPPLPRRRHGRRDDLDPPCDGCID